MAYSYTPSYIKQTVAATAKQVITAERWNELFNLLITQGDNTSAAIKAFIDDLNDDGADNVGTTYSGSTMDLQSALNLIATAIAARYTSTEVTAYITAAKNDCVTGITFDEDSGKFTITKGDNTTTEIDTNIEKIPASLTLEVEDGVTKLVITNDDGTETSADVSSLIHAYSFTGTGGITVSSTGTDGNKTVTIDLPDGVVTSAKLEANLQTTLEGYKTAAETASTSASSSASTATTKAAEAAASATSAASSATTATSAATTLTAQSKLAEAYAKGTVDGVPVASGEAGYQDNAKYYKEQAETVAGGDFAATDHTHTKSDITDFPTSMPASDVYDWAKAATKPTYTAADVGAAPTGFGLGAIAANITGTDLTTTLSTAKSGFYMGSSVTNAPSDSWWFFIVISHNQYWSTVIALPFTDATGNAYIGQSKDSGSGSMTWSGWSTLITSANIGSQSVNYAAYANAANAAGDNNPTWGVLRNTSFYATDTTPSSNCQINWTYG